MKQLLTVLMAALLLAIAGNVEAEPSAQFNEYLIGDVNMYLRIWPPRVMGNDVTYLVSHFRGLPSSLPCKMYNPIGVPTLFWASADVNGDCIVMGSDVVRLVNYFKGTTTLLYCSYYVPDWFTTAQAEDAGKPSGWPICH